MQTSLSPARETPASSDRVALPLARAAANVAACSGHGSKCEWNPRYESGVFHSPAAKWNNAVSTFSRLSRPFLACAFYGGNNGHSSRSARHSPREFGTTIITSGNDYCKLMRPGKTFLRPLRAYIFSRVRFSWNLARRVFDLAAYECKVGFLSRIWGQQS